LPGGTEEKHEKPQSGQLAFGPRAGVVDYNIALSGFTAENLLSYA